MGTALGAFLADNSGLGFAGSSILIDSILVVVVLAHYYTKISSVLLFWVASVLTIPFGATFGTLLTKTTANSRLGFGTKRSSLTLFIILVGLIIYTTAQRKPLEKQ